MYAINHVQYKYSLNYQVLCLCYVLQLCELNKLGHLMIPLKVNTFKKVASKSAERDRQAVIRKPPRYTYRDTLISMTILCKQPLLFNPYIKKIFFFRTLVCV